MAMCASVLGCRLHGLVSHLLDMVSANITAGDTIPLVRSYGGNMRHWGCPLLYAHLLIFTMLTQEPSFALQPGGQQMIEARCSKDLGAMDTAWELGQKALKDTLVVTEGLNTQAVEVVEATVWKLQ